MIIIDGKAFDTPALNPGITARIHTIATLDAGTAYTTKPNAVAWRRLHGLPSDAKPSATHVLLATPDGGMVALGHWPFGSPVTLTLDKGLVSFLCTEHMEEEYSPPEPKQPRLDDKEPFLPGPAMHSPDAIIANADTLSFYTRLDRIAAGCQRKARVLTAGEFITYVVPPGDFQVSSDAGW